MTRKSTGSATASAVLFVASGMLASILGIRQYDRVTTEPAWVASNPIEVGQVLTPSMLKQAPVKHDAIGIQNPQQLIGQRMKTSKKPGETFSAADFQTIEKKPPQTLAQHIPEGRVLYSLQMGTQGSIPLSQLQGGDRLDILVRGRTGVRTAATDVRLVGVIRPRSPAGNNATTPGLKGLAQKKPEAKSATGATTLVLAVYPEHVYPLANIGNKDAISLVLHSAHDLAQGNRITITPEKTHRPVEVLAGLSRSTVYVNR